MNKTTTLLALAAGTTALLTACGSAASTTPVAPLAAPQVATSAAAPAAPSTGTRPAPVADSGANVDADDQSGDGTTAVVRDARLTGGPGWVVIRTDDDRDARVLGATAVAPGRSGPVTVTVDGPVPATGGDDLTAVLHLDDGDGVFDESRDPAVLDVDDRDDDDRDDDDRDDDDRDDDDRDDDRDGDDIEDDDFDYRVG